MLELLLPRPFGYGNNRELFETSTYPAFDALGAAETLADMVLSQILQPHRMGRLVDHHRRDPDQPALEEILDTVLERIFTESPSEERLAEIQRGVQRVAVANLLSLGRSADLSGDVRSRVEASLKELTEALESSGADGPDADARRGLRRQLNRYWSRQETATMEAGAPAPPPGQPIGMGGWFDREELGCGWHALEN